MTVMAVAADLRRKPCGDIVIQFSQAVARKSVHIMKQGLSMTNHPAIASGRAGILVLVALSLAGCELGAKNAETTQAKAQRVVAAKPTVKTITEWDEYTGRFAAVESVGVRARVSGYLTAIHFKDGQLVNQGDLLFTIDRRPFELAAASADAETKAAESALDFARQELSRAETLRKSDTVPERLFDERASTVRQVEARLASAQASLDRAKLDLEFTELRAPASGRIDTHTVSVGNLISGEDTNATLLTTIVSLDPIRVTFDVDQDAYLKYVRGMQDGTRPSLWDGANAVRIALQGDQGFPRKGNLDFVSKRHGTLSLLAGIDLLTGKVHALVRDRHRSREFIELLRLIDAAYPPNTAIKLILDNHSAHISRETRAWLASRPVGRFELTFTPKHGSWLNLIEGFFSKFARSVLRHIRVASKHELKERIMAGIDDVNRHPVVHSWSYKLTEAA
jgi:RND family efflux transporter MFP subunit